VQRHQFSIEKFSLSLFENLLPKLLEVKGNA